MRDTAVYVSLSPWTSSGRSYAYVADETATGGL